ncbi:hypothetical protein [Prosthecobacter fluviatilis]|uniref:Uncharacterized protein n=1 Tax=Prosthecobacter fluviatilis TaxID=445931 RepID=A0ABW0KMH4_9BACT
MTILKLSLEECSIRLDTPFDPPESSVSDQEFEEEYYRLFDTLEGFLAAHGKNDAYGQGDYYLEPNVMRSRGMGFEVANSAIVTMDFLHGLQKLVSERAPAWEIYFRSDNFDYDVFINPSEVRIYRDSPDLLPQVGNNSA